MSKHVKGLAPSLNLYEHLAQHFACISVCMNGALRVGLFLNSCELLHQVYSTDHMLVVGIVDMGRLLAGRTILKMSAHAKS